MEDEFDILFDSELDEVCEVCYFDSYSHDDWCPVPRKNLETSDVVFDFGDDYGLRECE